MSIREKRRKIQGFEAILSCDLDFELLSSLVNPKDHCHILDISNALMPFH